MWNKCNYPDALEKPLIVLLQWEVTVVEAYVLGSFGSKRNNIIIIAVKRHAKATLKCHVGCSCSAMDRAKEGKLFSWQNVHTVGTRAKDLDHRAMEEKNVV
ncbi:hypothetical protein ATANTOWER_006181 [Ataeniobius toweri]|uniref:Uncharacterized protein n=1 Tax=Ataeniobius toweri TaxID=208326 RepID=A0ABU7AAM5_9TELE|nr:hypothetical protein [Ataeniobius toweri]